MYSGFCHSPGWLWTRQVAWKKEGCRPFDKAAESLEPSQEPEKKR